MSNTKATTEDLTGQIKKRINRSALTHKQKLSEVMDSLTIDKKYAHLVPIITNVVKSLVDEGNRYRLQKAAECCVSDVQRALTETYIPEENSLGWFPLSAGPENIFIPPMTDEQGNITRECRWVWDSEEEFDSLSYSQSTASHQIDEGLVALQQAVGAANKSLVFKTAGVELVVTDDLLVYGGMR